jgi:hypothetical protein
MAKSARCNHPRCWFTMRTCSYLTLFALVSALAAPVSAERGRVANEQARYTIIDGVRFTQMTDPEINDKIVGKTVSRDPASEPRSTSSIWHFYRNGTVRVVGDRGDEMDGTYTIADDSIVILAPKFSARLLFFVGDGGQLMLGWY